MLLHRRSVLYGMATLPDAAPPPAIEPVLAGKVRDRRPGIDPALNALVAEMLSKWPQDRPQSAREVLSRLTGSTVEAPYAGGPT